MNVLFISISSAVSNINNFGIYPDLLRKFGNEGHNIFIVCPSERKEDFKTTFWQSKNINILKVRTLNITKTNIIERGISTILIEVLFKKAIKKFFPNIHFDLILYSTPPITFISIIKELKQTNDAKTYLLLKDIFPQNAVDLGILSKKNPIYWYFRNKEKKLYVLSDYIGCMSEANVNYLLSKNRFLNSKNIEVCPNSIELKEKHCSPKLEIYEKFNIPINKTLIIYGGNLGKPQGIDFLIKILGSNIYNNELFFIIAGSGTEFNKLNKWFLRNSPQNAKLFHFLPKEEFESLIQISNIGLILLDKRFSVPNFPSRFLNYLEFKKPVVLATDRNTDIGLVSEQNGFGFWVESTDVTKFNEKIEKLVLDKSLQVKMGEAGYKYLLENYTVDTSYKKIMSHFQL